VACPACYASAEEIARATKASFEDAASYTPHYAVHPGTPLPILLVEDGRRVVRLARWGLIPRFMKDPKLDMRRVNAQAESLGGKSMWKALLNHRCAVVVNGFFANVKETKLRRKQTFFIAPQEATAKPLLLFAGLWDVWQPPERPAGDVAATAGAAGAPSSPIRSVAIVTTEAEKSLRWMHRRAPVVLHDDQQLETWLTCCEETKGKFVASKWWRSTIQPLLTPPSASLLARRAVGPAAGEGKDDPECIAPLPSEAEEESKKRAAPAAGGAEEAAEQQPAKIAKEQ